MNDVNDIRIELFGAEEPFEADVCDEPKRPVGICLVGAAGKMGNAIVEQIKLISTHSDAGPTRSAGPAAHYEAPISTHSDAPISTHSDAIPLENAAYLASAIEHEQSPLLGSPVSAIPNITYTSDLAAGAMASDVIVNFSAAESVARTISVAIAQRKPLVCGVTGLSDGTMDALKQAAAHIPVLYDANMSIGIAVMKKALRLLAQLLDFDVEISEVHHRHKKDTPSGTALSLAHTIAQVRPQSTVTCARAGMRADGDIGISSSRGGSAIGTHNVMFLGEHEMVSLSHQAMSRAAFATGAVRAALWLRAQDSGWYSMEDFVSP
ncbi:MAG: 4-hydroxy-tetrahydrodipicolinate reductase [Holosporales bacterium]|jgi:4-hydroxy-tetrahydrodipicolinate reductase|nr:4-hydroxy-tetrahydrodipicolinate reductase [Holosporales bacterium]